MPSLTGQVIIVTGASAGIGDSDGGSRIGASGGNGLSPGAQAAVKRISGMKSRERSIPMTTRGEPRQRNCFSPAFRASYPSFCASRCSSFRFDQCSTST